MFYVLLYVYFHSSFATILMGKRERAGCFASFVFLASRDSYGALPRDAMVAFAVCVLCCLLIILTFNF